MIPCRICRAPDHENCSCGWVIIDEIPVDNLEAIQEDMLKKMKTEGGRQ